MALNIKTPASRKITFYSDFRKDMALNPISRDLSLKKDEDSIKEAIKNLLLTSPGERLFQPALGSDVKKMLFDNMTPATISYLEKVVQDTINNYEPRITLISVEVIPQYDKNAVSINITFYARNIQSPVTVTVFLERIR
jgi:phage baseplate assembly protein W